ncbi:PKD domain-containing protein [Polluticaenibacter yanchengensis]|uniref:PKD domain-containing protein n=1 Tax=Polluticaenibacter yanchengensis TaxID=3014562 RepID=A0ABT4UQR0_9BACT|nr:PKD domain-containing protein [Chitinophagaceae bacterium LY-5]
MIRSLKYSICNVWFAVVFLLLGLNASAQLNADFSVDKDGGCAPLIVNMTNKTKGASTNAKYIWELGNGNVSNLKDPGATFYTPRLYNIKLTVIDGNQTSSVTKTVNVYEVPPVDFSFVGQSGCAPQTIHLKSKYVDDSYIYTWDFGNGVIKSGASLSDISYEYDNKISPPISLTISNSFGCINSKTINNTIDVLESPFAGFKTTVLTSCDYNRNIGFTNTTTGNGEIDYKWDFGDGATTTNPNPIYNYNKQGAYNVNLIATKLSNGCKDTAQTVITLGNFQLDFELVSNLCAGAVISFANLSPKGANAIEWWVNNNKVNITSFDTLKYTFVNTGTYKIKLVASYNDCRLELAKDIVIQPRPILTGFIIEKETVCQFPVKVSFKDTSNTNNKSYWAFNGSSWDNPVSTKRVFDTVFNSAANNNMLLKAVNEFGCESIVNMTIGLQNITQSFIINSNQNDYIDYGFCPGTEFLFSINEPAQIKTYYWTFGDGGNSTLANPKHTYTKAGVYTVQLSYETINGCKGLISYKKITVVNLKDIDFKFTFEDTVCGNTPAKLSVTNVSNLYYNWIIPNGEVLGNGKSSIEVKYNKEGWQSLKIALKLGQCIDTIELKDYTFVQAPFPKIMSADISCQAPDKVDFKIQADNAITRKWVFGDGKTEVQQNSGALTYSHTYAASGIYKVYLNTVNGNCEAKDSVELKIYKKQNYNLVLSKVDLCVNDTIFWSIRNLELLPDSSLHFLTGSNLPAGLALQVLNSGKTEISGYIANLNNDITNIRLFISNHFNNCIDSTNLVNVKVRGPIANFSLSNFNGCFKEAVIFKDLSVATSSPIVKWIYNFGDLNSQSFSNNADVQHFFKYPGTFYPTLTVLDESGCFSTIVDSTKQINLSGPKANFSAPTFSIPPGSSLEFTNTSDYYDANSTHTWILPDNTKSTNTEKVKFFFANTGEYKVTLITKNTKTGCTDTITKTVNVQHVKSIFESDKSLLDERFCLPVIYKFTNKSINAHTVLWDFGNGATSTDFNETYHTYTTMGEYIVKLYSYDVNGNVDSSEQKITIKVPEAKISVDTLFGCNNIEVAFKVELTGANSFSWDFGDGTIIENSVATIKHFYQNPGNYLPSVVLKDTSGCLTLSTLTKSIVVDNLDVTTGAVAPYYCSEKDVEFHPEVKSFSKDVMNIDPSVKWQINDGSNVFTSNNAHVIYSFKNIGANSATLNYSTIYGCKKEIKIPVEIKQKVTASLSIAPDVCRTHNFELKGLGLPTSHTFDYTWQIEEIGEITKPSENIVFEKEGVKSVIFTLTDAFCSDTVKTSILVKPVPTFKVHAEDYEICLGQTVKLHSTSNTLYTYQWTVNNITTNDKDSVVILAPKQDGNIILTATNEYNCSSSDSAFITVHQPIKLKGTDPVTICLRDSVKFELSGAKSYIWLKDSTVAGSLSNTHILKPTSTTTYQVVGFDGYNCFADTANILVKVNPLPTVDAGNDIIIPARTTAGLNPVASADVVAYQWKPLMDLSCVNCKNPLVTPQKSIQYTLHVTNSFNCKASDTINVSTYCNTNLVYLPDAFTPNNDGKNDRFKFYVSGVKQIRKILIYDRWGAPAFERQNIDPLDYNATWDGKKNGVDMPAGAYVYFIELECEVTGEIIAKKGTISLLR